MFNSPFFAQDYFGEHFKSLGNVPVIKPAYLHIWPDSATITYIEAISTVFSIRGIPYETDVLALAKTFSFLGVPRELVIQALPTVTSIQELATLFNINSLDLTSSIQPWPKPFWFDAISSEFNIHKEVDDD